MLDEIINNPELDQYLSTFKKGKIIFLEGDPSQDLYILVSGQLDILKGNKKIFSAFICEDLHPKSKFFYNI